jgi:hypothetical protein
MGHEIHTKYMGFEGVGIDMSTVRDHAAESTWATLCARTPALMPLHPQIRMAGDASADVDSSHLFPQTSNPSPSVTVEICSLSLHWSLSIPVLVKTCEKSEVTHLLAKPVDKGMTNNNTVNMAI